VLKKKIYAIDKTKKHRKVSTRFSVSKDEGLK
jgi:hypothetical protein